MTKRTKREIISLINMKRLLSDIFLHWFSRFFVIFMLIMMLIFCTLAVAQIQQDSFLFTNCSSGTANRQLNIPQG